MRAIGTVVRLQIQRSSLKTGQKPHTVYDPAPLLAVPRLAVSPAGVLGAADGSGGAGAERAGAWLVDVHHQAHPGTKNADLLHGVSLGFTSHYEAMRAHFGDRLVTGCAGENIVVAADRRFTFEDLAAGVAIHAPDGAPRVRLRVLEVAHPCRPFTGWALGGARVDPEVLKSHLQFLDGGMRGFYCVGEGTGVVEVGDEVVLA